MQRIDPFSPTIRAGVFRLQAVSVTTATNTLSRALSAISFASDRPKGENANPTNPRSRSCSLLLLEKSRHYYNQDNRQACPRPLLSRPKMAQEKFLDSTLPGMSFVTKHSQPPKRASPRPTAFQRLLEMVGDISGRRLRYLVWQKAARTDGRSAQR